MTTTTPGSDPLNLEIASLGAGYEQGRLTVRGVAGTVLARIAAAGDDHVWIHRVPDQDLLAAADALDRRRGEAGTLPLYGLPFAVKDNIDAAGLPTTAACPPFAYTPAASATVVARLIAAGALLVGKTNLDQFATGLVGVRSPYGVPRNPFDPAMIPGGSSSGSAVAVAAGLVSFALGTDTAGSGRVPAAFGNIVGLKPTRGLIPLTGVVPACKSLDCVSIFALTVADATTVLGVAAGPDPADAGSRPAPPGFHALAAVPAALTIAVPRRDQRDFFCDLLGPHLFDAACDQLSRLGATLVEIDFTPFAEAAALLYGGPWVAERTAAIAEFLERSPEALHPVTRRITEGGRAWSAIDAFRAQYRLEALKRTALAVFDQADALLVPTAGRCYTIAAVEADPLALNTTLGAYTNFTNLFDLAALALPAGFRPDRLPQGVTLIAPAWHDGVLAAIGRKFQDATALPLGATGLRATTTSIPVVPSGFPTLDIALLGAHMSGEPLNPAILALGGRLVGPRRTAPHYRLYKLGGTGPARPGLVRVTEGGTSIDMEIWRLPAAAIAPFLASLPQPLGLGPIDTEDGRKVQGCLCEAAGVTNALEISQYGGWRAYRAQNP
jgi:allophanate hydrolase